MKATSRLIEQAGTALLPLYLRRENIKTYQCPEEDAYDYTPESFSPYDDPMDYSPYESEDIVDYFQDLPVIRDFRLGGWTASAIVVGVAALSGAWFSKRRG